MIQRSSNCCNIQKECVFLEFYGLEENDINLLTTISRNYKIILEYSNPKVLYANYVLKTIFRTIGKLHELVELHMNNAEFCDSNIQTICKTLVGLKVLDINNYGDGVFTDWGLRSDVVTIKEAFPVDDFASPATEQF